MLMADELVNVALHLVFVIKIQVLTVLTKCIGLLEFFK